jgi:hypothetical protein
VLPVVLLTDFGNADHYLGVLHAVLEREAPGVVRIDLGHEVPAGDVWTASFLLRCAWPHLPAGCVVLAVVDPGVGGARRALAVRLGGRVVVGPDNGLVAAVGPADDAVELAAEAMRLPAPSPTFHGRDLFAPAAARLAAGAAPAALGRGVAPASLVPCPLPEPRRTAEGLEGVVLHVDRFGNLVSNLRPAERGAAIELGGRRLRRVRTYAEAAPGELVVLEGSSGYLELAVNGASAAAATGLSRGDAILLLGAPE